MQSYCHPQARAFLDACKFNEYSTIEQLLDIFPQLVYEYDHGGMTALHWACKKNHEKIAMLLIRRGAWVDAPDTLGRRPLILAVKSQNAHLVRELLLRKANPWTQLGEKALKYLAGNQMQIEIYLTTFRAVGCYHQADILMRLSKSKKRRSIFEGVVAFNLKNNDRATPH